MEVTCATCSRDVVAAFVGGVRVWRHAASWQVLSDHRIEPAGAPTTATKADPHPTSAAQAAPSSPLPLQSATE